MKKQYDKENIESIVKDMNSLIKNWQDYINADRCRYTVRIEPASSSEDEYTSFIDIDKNIIEVYVPAQFSLLPVIHEIGHYIGCRQRDKRISCLIKAVVYWFIRDIYLHVYQQASEDKSNTIQFSDGKTIDKELMENLVSPLNEDFFSQLEEDIRSTINNITTWPMRDSLVVICNKVVETLWDSDGGFFMSMRKDVQKKMKIMKNHYTTDKEEFTRSAYCIEEVNALFSEPIADCFMIKISGITFSDYLQILLTIFYDKFEAESLVRGKELYNKLLQAWMNQEALSRLIVISFAVFGKKNIQEPKMAKVLGRILPRSKWRFIHLFWTGFKEKQFDVASKYIERIKSFCDQDIKIQSVFNPCDIIYRYISEISDDERYNNLTSEVQKATSTSDSKLENLVKIVSELRRKIVSELRG